MFSPDLPPDWLHVTYRDAPPGFCFVELEPPTDKLPPDQTRRLEDLENLCCNGRVSSKLFREKVFRVFRDIVEKDERRATGKLIDQTRNYCYLTG